MLVDESTIDGVCDRVTQITADELDLPLSGVWLHDDSSGTLEPVAATPEAQEMIDEQPAFDPGDALAWEAFENGRELLVTDAQSRRPVQSGDCGSE